MMSGEIVFKCAVCSYDIKRASQFDLNLWSDMNISCPRCKLSPSPPPPLPQHHVLQQVQPIKQEPFNISEAVANIQLPPLHTILSNNGSSSVSHSIHQQHQPIMASSQSQVVSFSSSQPTTITTVRLNSNTAFLGGNGSAAALSSPPQSHLNLPLNPLPASAVTVTHVNTMPHVSTLTLPGNQAENLLPPHITSQLQAQLPPLPPSQMIQIKTTKSNRPPPEVFMSLNPVAVTNQIHPNMLHQHQQDLQQQQQQQQVQNNSTGKKGKKSGGPRKIRQSHSGKEKKFSCQFCDFKSSTNYNVSAHVKSVHCKIKDFSCDMCEFKSSKKWNLKSHVKTVHDKVKDYHCNLCDYRSSRRDALIKHYGDVHQKITSLAK